MCHAMTVLKLCAFLVLGKQILKIRVQLFALGNEQTHMCCEQFITNNNRSFSLVIWFTLSHLDMILGDDLVQSTN